MKKQKYQSGFAHLIIVIIVTVVLLSAVGFVVWKNFDRFTRSTNNTNNKSDTSNKNDSAINNTSNNGAEVKSASNAAKEIYDLISGKYSSNANLSIKMDDDISGAGPFHKLNGKDYYVLAAKGSTIRIDLNNNSDDGEWRVALNTIVPDLIDYFASNNFKKSDPVFGADKVYTSQYVNCGYYSGFSNPFILYCADISSYDTAAQIADPLIKAYRAGTSITAVLTVSLPDISEVNTEGYQTATMGISNAMSFFYKKEGGDWDYFDSFNGSLTCQLFNTNELKAAFRGTACYDSSSRTNSTVQ